MLHRTLGLTVIAACAACDGGREQGPPPHAVTVAPAPPAAGSDAAEPSAPDAAAPGASRSSVEVGMPTVGAGLSAEIVRRFVQRAAPRFRSCYDLGLRKDPALRGHIDVTFDIDADGKVQNAAALSSSTVSDATVVVCFTGAVSLLLFPRPATAPVTVRQPFDVAP